MEFSYTTLVPHVKSSRGFSLIELIIVITIIAVLFVGVAIIFNPAAQIAKTQNATRQHDLDEIRTAVESYYDDTGCYPTSLGFNQEFAANGKIYMTNIPEDPNCRGNGNNCYIYQTDTNASCPQWNVLYAHLASPLPVSVTCPLTSISNNCVPTNYQSMGFNYCVTSGNIDCTTISSVAITPPPVSSGPRIPTPTPTPVFCNTYYACTGIGVNGCNVLDANATRTCKQLGGGGLTCYCDSQCSNQCH